MPLSSDVRFRNLRGPEQGLRALRGPSCAIKLRIAESEISEYNSSAEVRMKFRTVCSRCLRTAFAFTAAAACAQVVQNSNTISADLQDWPMYNYDSFGTRWNRGE